MKSIIEEIKKLRGNLPSAIEQECKDRYRLTIEEDDKTHTAYFFTCPIRNISKEQVELQFENSHEKSIFRGSDCEVTITDEIIFKNSYGSCRVTIPMGFAKRTNNTILCEKMTIVPTFNGLAFKVNTDIGEEIELTLSAQQQYNGLRKNSKYVALMTRWFQPLITVLSTGTLGKNGEVLSDARLICEKIDSKTVLVKIRANHEDGRFIMFEINMHDSKLIQDTTVESGNPGENNVFGSTALIGTSICCGEQWLFSRIDYSKMSDLIPHKLNKVKLHLPRLNDNDLVMSAHRVESRFCSFGSNWKNRVGAGEVISAAYRNGNYINFDITDFLTSNKSKRLAFTDGFVIKTGELEKGFAAVSTADSCYLPQILEINYE